jgi:hypothetical protein
MNEDELLDALVQNHAVGQKQYHRSAVCRDNLGIDVSTRDRPNPKNWQLMDRCHENALPMTEMN